MSKDDFKECRSPWDYITTAEKRGAKVTIDGNTATIETDKGKVHVRTCPRPMPKQERDLFNFWMWGLGLLTVIALAFGIARLIGVA